ncbi:MAG: tyrosinase family protein [Bryobacteraceae bacterium]
MSDEQSKSTEWSRYQRVKQILDEAAGEAHPSYQGHGQFWNLPYSQFLAAKLYGIRMIAPVQAASPGLPVTPAAPANGCCHSDDAPAPAGTRSPGRGAASGLIRGLKGQAPFDGSQFPRLPWGGKPVSLEDIAFIEQWIDDGCPEHDTPDAAGPAHQARRNALAFGERAHALDPRPVNAFRDESGKLKVRKNINFLLPDELARFRAAVARMKSRDAFEQDERSFGYWARIHANQCQHSWEQFVTWHRAYLYFFEQHLQDFDATVTLPYWDWAADRENVEKSIQDMESKVALDNGVVPEAYRCWIDEDGINQLKALGVPDPVLNQLRAVIDKKFDSGARLFNAAGIQWGGNPQSDQAIIQVLGKINPLWHYQRWPGGDKDIIFEAYPSPEDVTRILELDDFFAFASGPEDNHFFGALENIHNLIHNFSGGLNPNFGNSTEPMNIRNPSAGDMVNAGRTAFDPIFWGHHANVDRLWAEWQKMHPDSGPDDPGAILPPWSMTVRDTYSTASLGYEYMQAAHVFPTEDGHMPIARFLSAPAQVHPKVVETHRRAEIRLHRVKYVTRAGFFIRAFLNLPEANEKTPTRGNDHYVGMLNMFTGLCTGGPGHCDTPDETRRQFDQRPRHHKTPANFRLDATGAVARLKAAGAADFHVNLVALNIDGTPATDALKLDAVSLNFYD